MSSDVVQHTSKCPKRLQLSRPPTVNKSIGFGSRQLPDDNIRSAHDHDNRIDRSRRRDVQLDLRRTLLTQ